MTAGQIIGREIRVRIGAQVLLTEQRAPTAIRTLSEEEIPGSSPKSEVAHRAIVAPGGES